MEEEPRQKIRKKDVNKRRIRRRRDSREITRLRKQALKKNEPIDSEDVLAMGRALELFSQGKDVPLVGLDRTRIVKILSYKKKGRGGKLDKVAAVQQGFKSAKSLSRKETEHAIQWVRRLVVADLWAQGWTVQEMARFFTVTRGEINRDLRALGEFQVLAASVEKATESVAKTLNRMEALQRSAMKDLAELEDSEERADISHRINLRNEITERELKVFDTLKKMGYLRNAEGASPEEESTGTSVNVNLNFPKPDKPMADMSTEELVNHMEAYVSAVRSKSLQSSATDADYKEVNGGKKE